MATADQMALEIMLDDRPRKQARLAALAAVAAAVLGNRHECPDCGDEGPHDDNGLPSSSDNFALACRTCGMNFNPYEGV